MYDTLEKGRLGKFKWLIAGSLFFLAMMPVTLFLMPAPFVRLALVYAFPAYTPSLGSVTLSPEGKLTLYDLVIHDAAGPGRQPLLTIREVEAVFDWAALRSRQIRQVRVEKVTIYTRLTSPSPLSLFGLFASSASSAPTAEFQRDTLPLWIDTLSVQGSWRLEAGKGFTPATAEWPLTLQMSMSGDRLQPNRRFLVAVGNAESIPEKAPKSPAGATPTAVRIAGDTFGLRADFDMQLVAGDTRVVVRRLVAGSVALRIANDALRQYAPKLPVEFSGPLSTNFVALDLSGQIAVRPEGEIGFDGQLRLQDLSILWPAEGDSAFDLERLTVAGHVDSRLDRWTPETLRVRQGMLRWASLSYGSQAIHNFETAWHIDGQKLTTERGAAQLFDGHIIGSLTWDLETHSIPQCDFQLKRIDMHKALANLSPEHLDAEGRASGVVHLMRNSEGTLSGSVELTFDEPGVLHVGEVAEVRQKLVGNVGLELANLAMYDLRQYPFKEGKVYLESVGENSQLKIHFVRQHNRSTEVMPPRQSILNGKEVRVRSLVVPTIDLTIPIRGTSFAAILSLISGV